MGPRIREDNGWGRDGFPLPSSLGQALRGNNGSGCENDGLGARMGGRGRGWVPASARTTDGEGMDSRSRLHWGRLYAGITGVGARMTGWARGWEVGEGDGSPHPRGQRMGKGWIPAPVFIGAGSSREKRGGWRDGRPQGSPLRRRELRVREFFAGVRMRGGRIRRLGRRERLLPRLPVGGVWRRR